MPATPDFNVTVLAFDFGTKNIGAACSASPIAPVQELPPIRAKDGIPDWTELEKLLNEWQVSKVIVGKPLNMDGSESELSKRARKFANRVHGRFGIAVEMVDERLSTREAKEEAVNRGHRGNYGQSPVDSIAARLILETWLQGDDTPE